MYLRSLRRRSYRKEEQEVRKVEGRSFETLQDLAAMVDRKNKERQRFSPPAKEKTLRNVGFLVAMIMDSEGRSDATRMANPCGSSQKAQRW